MQEVKNFCVIIYTTFLIIISIIVSFVTMDEVGAFVVHL